MEEEGVWEEGVPSTRSCTFLSSTSPPDGRVRVSRERHDGLGRLPTPQGELEIGRILNEFASKSMEKSGDIAFKHDDDELLCHVPPASQSDLGKCSPPPQNILFTFSPYSTSSKREI